MFCITSKEACCRATTRVRRSICGSLPRIADSTLATSACARCEMRHTTVGIVSSSRILDGTGSSFTPKALE